MRRIVWELRPYLNELVIVGGWVPYLYKRYGGFASWMTSTSLTAEVDVLVDRPLLPAGRPSIPEILRKAGFRPAVEEGGLAVWERDVRSGEKIEFLVPHQGASRQEGAVVPVTAQNGMGAIPLGGLDFMRRFRRRLAIPAATPAGGVSLEIWVPTLGAYVVNKSSTFARRQARQGGANPKRAKDLLYLRDLMAAGAEVVGRIESDLAEMVQARETRKLARDRIRHASNTLGLALGGAFQPLLPEVARALKEREPGFTDGAALADIRGHLADMLEILEGFAG
ncbi:MAG TPA: GSU2403 family nucleotidyltransferase fold protein [Longimicrobium sp.]